MKHEICDACETVKYCSQHGCIPLQPQSPKPCRSPYCECTPGTCAHPGCYDARGEPFAHPPAQPTLDWREAVLDLIDECPGLTMDQDRWLTQRVKEIVTTPAALEKTYDPCPGCTPGHVCRTPACGRLQLPQSHPLRNTQ